MITVRQSYMYTREQHCRHSTELSKYFNTIYGPISTYGMFNINEWVNVFFLTRSGRMSAMLFACIHIRLPNGNRKWFVFFISTVNPRCIEVKLSWTIVQIYHGENNSDSLCSYSLMQRNIVRVLCCSVFSFWLDSTRDIIHALPRQSR
jgi:hypothetical protein